MSDFSFIWGSWEDESILPLPKSFENENPMHVRSSVCEGGVSMMTSLGRWIDCRMVLKGSYLTVHDKNDATSHGTILSTMQLSGSSYVSTYDDPFVRCINKEPNEENVLVLNFKKQEEVDHWTACICRQIALLKWFFGRYQFGQTVGMGSYGVVRECKDLLTGTVLVAKVVNLSPSMRPKALREIDMLTLLSEKVWHPGIVNVVRLWEDNDKLFIIQQNCSGGELFDRINRSTTPMGEDFASDMLRQIMEALKELHGHGILHLDVKPENLLFESQLDDAPLVLVDFGLSATIPPQGLPASGYDSPPPPQPLGGDTLPRSPGGVAAAAKPVIPAVNIHLRRLSLQNQLDPRTSSSPGPASPLSFNCSLSNVAEEARRARTDERDHGGGSAGYAAPEVIKERAVSPAADVFSAGVVLHLMLVRRLPFRGKDKREILSKTLDRELKLQGREWEGVSEGAKELVQLMLQKDPLKRISVDEVLAHPWLTCPSSCRTDSVDTSKPTTGGVIVFHHKSDDGSEL